MVGLKLTGNVGNEDIHRCATIGYNKGKQQTSQLYFIINGRDIDVGNPFPYLEYYNFLSTRNTLLEAGEGPDKIEMEESENGSCFERPVGTKAAKCVKKRKEKGRKRMD